jgi:regulator of sigma E protease
VILTLLSFIVVLGVIVLVHEWGHFIAARLCGIRVITFSIGFGPTVKSWRRGSTEYQLAWLPLGGYVQMAGMIDEQLDEGSITGAPDEFMSKTALQKAFVISAGVIMNFLLAALVYSVVAFSYGMNELDERPLIGSLSANMPAIEAGFEAMDRVLEVNHEPLSSWDELATAIHERPKMPTQFLVERGTEQLILTLEPKAQVLPGMGEVGLIGIAPNYLTVEVGFFESFAVGVRQTLLVIGIAKDTVISLVSGEAGLKDVGGPIFIAQLSGESARGGLASFLGFLAFISVNIGFLNILPIPVLDGGHLVYIALEAIFRRPIPTRIKLWIQQAGMVLLLGLTVIVMRNDILRAFRSDDPKTPEAVEVLEPGAAPGGELEDAELESIRLKSDSLFQDENIVQP